MKVACKLCRNGSSTTVTIPRRVLNLLRWHAGDEVILEMTDIDTISVHPRRLADFRVPGTLGVIEGSVPGATK